jgi:methyl-accepting chemotaxis protein
MSRDRFPRLRLGALSVRASLVVAVVGTGVAGLLVGVVGLLQTQSLAAGEQRMYESSLEPATDIGQLNGLLWKARWASISQGSATDSASAKKFGDEMTKAFNQIAERIKVYRSRPVSAAERAGIETFAADWDAYLAARKRGREIKATGDLVAYDQFRISTLNPTAEKSVADLEALCQVSVSAASQLAREGGQARDRARTLIVVLLAGGLALATGLTLLVGRSTANRLGRLRHALDTMAAGDLTVTSDDSSATEIGQMSTALNQAIGRIRQAISALATSSTRLAGQAGDLFDSSRSLSTTATTAFDRTSSIGTTVNGIATSVSSVASGAEQMSASIGEIASNAAQAVAVVTDAVEVAKTTEALMVRLDTSSSEIGNVVKVITSIAEQTNMLALNATIEAARAGESGKGFAVVAGEVKDLARATATATEEIGRRVEAIQHDTESAVKALSAINEVIGRVNTYQETIASAVEEQNATTGSMTVGLSSAASGTSEVSAQMAEVVAVSEQTKTTAEASEAAASSLTELADEINAAVGAFRY